MGGDKQRSMIIGYDLDLLMSVRKRTKINWIFTAVAAHEYAHHYLNHFDRSLHLDIKLRELAADTAIGFFLRRLGAPSLDSAQIVMEFIASIESIEGYPPRDERKKAIENGWHQGT